MLLGALLIGAQVSYAALPTKQRSSTSVRKERQDETKKLNQTRRKLDANQRQISQRLNDLNALAAQINSTSAKITAKQKQISNIDARITSASDSITLLGAEIEKLKEGTRKSLREARTRRQTMSATSMVLNAQSFRQAVKRAGYLKQLEASRTKKTKRLQAANDALTLKKQELNELRHAQALALAQLTQQQQQLETQQAQMQGMVSDLRRQGNALEKELVQRQNKLAQLDRELDRIIAEEQRKAEEERLAAERKRQAEEAERKRLAAEAEAARLAAEEKARQEAEAQNQLAQTDQKSQKKDKKKKDKKDTKKDSKKEVAATSASATKEVAQPKQDTKATQKTQEKAKAAPTVPGATFAQSKGRLMFPVSGDYTIVSRFGRSKYADLSRVEMDNPGIDIQASQGSSARAVYPGEVTSIFKLDGYHNIVMVRHGEYLTIYANIDQLSVRKGDQVQAGQHIGKIYSDNTDGGRTILHFEVRKERQKLNPLEWVKL